VLVATVATYGLAVDSTLASYRDAHPGASDGELFAAILSDSYVGVPVLRLVDAHATRSTAATFAYEFAWQPPQYDERLGACHGLDVPFVFDTLGDATEPLTGPNPPQQLAHTRTLPGSPPRSTETAAGQSTTSAAGQPCASISRHKLLAIHGP